MDQLAIGSDRDNDCETAGKRDCRVGATWCVTLEAHLIKICECYADLSALCQAHTHTHTHTRMHTHIYRVALLLLLSLTFALQRVRK